MKILVAGDWHSNLHEETIYRSFAVLGHQVVRFAWHQYFDQGGSGIASYFWRKVRKAQNKFLVGPRLWALNRDLRQLVAKESPDLVFIYRGTHIFPSTLRAIKRIQPRMKMIGYNNDDPFSSHYPRYVWRLFKRSIPLYDLVYAYRHHNLIELEQAGAKQVGLLRSWYLPERNYKVELTSAQQAQYGCDIVFAGHYEEDGRLAVLERVAESGFHLNLFGPEWNRVVENSSALKRYFPVKAVRDEQYNLALNGAKVALCFLSKLNRDTYTRRCFEIPATGTIMLAEYTDDLASMFEPEKEALYFRTADELLAQLTKIVRNPELRASISEAAAQRLRKDGHDVVSRMRSVLKDVEALPPS